MKRALLHESEPNLLKHIYHIVFRRNLYRSNIGLRSKTQSAERGENQMKVLAIFTCYNRRELTRQSMELLGQNKNVTFDYVIVNDGSTDGTDEMLAAMPYEIDLINGDGGLFWNRGMYEAIEPRQKSASRLRVLYANER